MTIPAGIPFQGVKRENAELAAELAEAFARALAGGAMVHGEAADRLEAMAAADAGRAHAVAVGSGSDALAFALRAAGIGAGDEVLCPAVSFAATAMSIARAGASPVFVDVAADGMMDLPRADAAIRPTVRAAVFVQLWGALRDPDAIEAWAASRGLALFEDAAQAYGARSGSRRGGSMGRASALSYSPLKVLGGAGNGGMLLTDDAALAARARRIRLHGREGGRSVEVGENSRMAEVVAASLLCKAPRLAGWAARRRGIAARYGAVCRELALETAVDPDDAGSVWHKFIVRHPARDRLAGALAARGVATAVHYPRPLHAEPAFADARRAADLSGAERHARTGLSLPIYAQMTDAEVDAACAALRDAAAALDAGDAAAA